jgi:cysteinyl-tRNA synthetase
MTRDLLGDTLDIHAGGEDLVFPHHTNEIAQSETLTGKQFVRYWVHIRHLMINGKKMSKSLGNYVSFDEVLAKYTADTFRYFYLGTHYRRPLDYTDDAMKSAEGSAKRLENTFDLLEAAAKAPDTNIDLGPRERKLLDEVEKHRTAFEAAMDDDIDSHTALDSLHAVSGAINEYLTTTPNKGVTLRAKNIYRGLLDSLGLFEKRGGGTDKLTEDLIRTLIDLRNQYRKEKNYKNADEVRNKLITLGVTLADNAEGTSWKIEKK